MPLTSADYSGGVGYGIQETLLDGVIWILKRQINYQQLPLIRRISHDLESKIPEGSDVKRSDTVSALPALKARHRVDVVGIKN